MVDLAGEDDLPADLEAKPGRRRRPRVFGQVRPDGQSLAAVVDGPGMRDVRDNFNPPLADRASLEGTPKSPGATGDVGVVDNRLADPKQEISFQHDQDFRRARNRSEEPCR